MGEFVAEMQERMLPEYEQMKHFKICTPQQIRDCIRTRERLQLKLTQSNIGASHYLDFILYEKQIYQMITQKEKATGLILYGLKAAISTRITRLYREMTTKFVHDELLWKSYIKYSQKSTPLEVAGIYEKMLSYHGDNAVNWADAALWIYQNNRKNMARVRDLLLRGLQRHATSEPLNKCFFDIMLKEAVVANDRRDLGDNSVSEQDIALERLEVIYRNSLLNITNVEYYLKLLDSCLEYDELTAPLQCQIIKDMQDKFAREPMLWDALAQRELSGHSLADLNNLQKKVRERRKNAAAAQAEDEDGDDSDGVPEKKPRPISPCIWQQRTLKRRIELCTTVYKSAVEVLPTQKMWCLYIDAMLALNKDLSTGRTAKQECLMSALQAGHKSKLMHIEHYATLHKILTNIPGGDAVAVRVLTEALEHNKSLRMHELLLVTHIANDDEPRVYELFQQARETLGPDSLPLWRRIIAYYRAREDLEPANRVQEIYALACADASPEFAQLRCDYLLYCWHTDSPDKAREEYKRLVLMPPMSLQLHRQMAKLEAGLTNCNVKSWRMCYEYMGCYFGAREPTVWLDYIAFERDHGDPKCISLLTKRALSTLQPEYVVIFETERALAQVGVERTN